MQPTSVDRCLRASSRTTRKNYTEIAIGGVEDDPDIEKFKNPLNVTNKKEYKCFVRVWLEEIWNYVNPSSVPSQIFKADFVATEEEKIAALRYIIEQHGGAKGENVRFTNGTYCLAMPKKTKTNEEDYIIQDYWNQLLDEVYIIFQIPEDKKLDAKRENFIDAPKDEMRKRKMVSDFGVSGKERACSGDVTGESEKCSAVNTERNWGELKLESWESDGDEFIGRRVSKIFRVVEAGHSKEIKKKYMGQIVARKPASKSQNQPKTKWMVLYMDGEVLVYDLSEISQMLIGDNAGESFSKSDKVRLQKEFDAWTNFFNTIKKNEMEGEEHGAANGGSRQKMKARIIAPELLSNHTPSDSLETEVCLEDAQGSAKESGQDLDKVRGTSTGQVPVTRDAKEKGKDSEMETEVTIQKATDIGAAKENGKDSQMEREVAIQKAADTGAAKEKGKDSLPRGARIVNRNGVEAFQLHVSTEVLDASILCKWQDLNRGKNENGLPEELPQPDDSFGGRLRAMCQYFGIADTPAQF